MIKMPVRRGIKAWLLYWETQPGGPLPLAEDGEVVAVLPSTWGDDRVRNVLERLFLERAATLAELVNWRNSGSSPYPSRPGTYMHSIAVGGTEYYCGHNPILKARKVQNLVAVGEYELTWEEVSIQHHTEFCRLNLRIDNCPEAAQGSTVSAKRWSRRTDDTLGWEGGTNAEDADPVR